jgi:hypothetical protein
VRAHIAAAVAAGLSAASCAAAPAQDVPVQPMVDFSEAARSAGAAPVAAAMPPDDRALLDGAINSWVHTPLMRRDDLRYASACMPHLCVGNRIDVVFDDRGGAWIGVVSNGVRRVYGPPPPPEVSAVLGR